MSDVGYAGAAVPVSAFPWAKAIAAAKNRIIKAILSFFIVLTPRFCF
jgi:hypothetical protein